MLKKIVLSVFFFSSLALSAQTSKMKKADNFMSKLSYAYALEIYQKFPEAYKSDVNLTRKIGECHYYLGDHINAERSFREVVNSAESMPVDFLMLAEILKINGNVSESKKYMSVYSDLIPNDSRSLRFKNNPNYLENINNQNPYFEIFPLAGNSNSADFGAYPNGDELYVISSRHKNAAIYREWSWNKGHFLDVYKGQITVEGGISKLNRLNKRTNTKFHEGPLCFTADSKTVYFTRNNISKGNSRHDLSGVQNLKLYKSEIGENGRWGKPTELPFNSENYSTGLPALSSNGKTLYFVSDMPGGFGGTDIYSVTIHDDGTYGVPVNLGEKINTEGKEMFPWIDNENILYFSSDGHQGMGGLDVFAALPNANGQYSDVMNLGRPINSESDDFAFIVMPGKQSGFVSSNRKGGMGDDDIYGFTQIRTLKRIPTIEINVAELSSGNAINGASLKIFNKKTGALIGSVQTNSSGKVSFVVEPDTEYVVEITNDNYYPEQVEFSAVGIELSQDRIEKTVQLKKDQGFSIYAKICDAKSSLPLNNVKITIHDLLSKELLGVFTTNSIGEIQQGILGKNLNDSLNYKIELVKEGYLPKTLNYLSKILKPGLIDLSDELKNQLRLDPTIKDLTEMVQINPINFDLNKYNIRPDAAVELDKIVAIMNTYPDMVVELGSHTDCRASQKYNLNLSDKRAKASAEYIKSRITKPERIYGKGYGESRLLNNCSCEGNVESDCTEEEHAQNRRTEFKAVSIGVKTN